MATTPASVAAEPGRADDGWAGFQATQRSALAALVAGDPEPFKALWDQTSQASLLGAFGGVAQGWDEVRDRLAAVAVFYRDGVYRRFEQLEERVHGDTAYTVHVEEIHSHAPDGEREVRERRVTKVCRRGESGWRIVHMHSDPLVTTAFPDRGHPTESPLGG
ncbi:nuclear transport factor 2 family protein [Isoptericola cucumis]|uniref:YybH family protein n=1 Tax=Isoptericola cucumis TaxID=1776856 RepID=UPI00320B55FD